MSNQHIAIIGASGGLGSAFVKMFSNESSNKVYAFSRSTITNQPTNTNVTNIYKSRIDFADEASIKEAAEYSTQNAPLDCVIVATGMLHDTNMMPEKSLRHLSATNFERSFLVNTIGPALVAKHFLSKLHRNQRGIFAVLSARVGSIEDNRLGGWYAYRAAKAALNMLIKTASIEIAWRQKQTIVVGLHPGTVDTHLSQSFQQRVPRHKLFTPDDSVKRLMSVLERLSAKDSGKVFAWDGSEVPY